MIIRERPSALRLFFMLRGTIVARIWPQILGVGLLAAVVVAAHQLAPHLVPGLNPQPFSLIGITLSVFLSFRNSSCYDRWWEARKLWGQIIQTAHDLVRQTAILGDAPERKAIIHAMIDLGHAAVTQQRRLSAEQAQGKIGRRGHTPNAIMTEITLTIAALLRQHRLEPIEAHGLNESVNRLSQAIVSCERLANTPLPFAYTLLLHRTAYLFCFLLPFGFADSLGWFTPLASAIVAYTFFGLDALGEELEEPFGLAPNDLPIAAYATMIEIALKTALGEPDVPPMPQPQDHILI